MTTASTVPMFREDMHVHNRAHCPPGWRIDRDLWLWRRTIKGDATQTYWTDNATLANHGFVDGGKVYTRTVELAQAYDLAHTRETAA